MNAEGWCRFLVDRLVDYGVDTFYASPGSRSTPLILALARHPVAKLHWHIDERGQAYRAVGYARATGRPAGWVTTSGTAAANGLPAVVEAAQDAVPLLCLTADRPPELRGTGANQTIDQLELFGDYPAVFRDWPVPQDAPAEWAEAFDADLTVLRGDRGVVHWNLAFREPFDAEGATPPSPDGFAPPPWEPLSPDPARLNTWLADGPPGWVVVGALVSSSEREAVRAFVQRLGWPTFAEVLSGLAGEQEAPFRPLPDRRWRQPFDPPTRVLHLGGRLLSKTWWEALGRMQPDLLQVESSIIAFDPGVDRHTSVQMDFAAELPLVTVPPGETVEAVSPPPFGTFPLDGIEAAVAHYLTTHMPADHGLWLSASLPVRLADWFHGPRDTPLQVAANRGASGIDGILHAAVGYAEGLQAPVTCLIGDLATLHDLNGLTLLQQPVFPVIAVVLNNDGGGIFELLPVAQQQADVFTECFSTPHGLALAPVAQALGVAAESVHTAEEFATLWNRWIDEGRSGVIEVRSQRSDTAAFVKAWLQGDET